MRQQVINLAPTVTSETYTDRRLQHSETITVPVKTLFLMTGNNLSLVGDMTRRLFKVRLKPKNENLAEREYAFDPLVKAKEMRNQIISSVLSLINHFKHADTEISKGAIPSFGDWDKLVRQPLAFIGRSIPELNLRDLKDISVDQQSQSTDKENDIMLLKALAIEFGVEEYFKATPVFEGTLSNSTLRDAVYGHLQGSQLTSSAKIGSILKPLIDKSVMGMRLKGKQVSGSWTYCVEVNSDSPYFQEIATAHALRMAPAVFLEDVATVPRSEKWHGVSLPH